MARAIIAGAIAKKVVGRSRADDTQARTRNRGEWGENGENR